MKTTIARLIILPFLMLGVVSCSSLSQTTLGLGMGSGKLHRENVEQRAKNKEKMKSMVQSYQPLLPDPIPNIKIRWQHLTPENSKSIHEIIVNEKSTYMIISYEDYKMLDDFLLDVDRFILQSRTLLCYYRKSKIGCVLSNSLETK